MATTVTPTILAGTTHAGTADAEKCERSVGIVRNMIESKRIKEKTAVVELARTMNSPSPPKLTASNSHAGQSHIRARVDTAIAHELADARYLVHDLADHVLGHIVSTNLASEILQNFVQDKVVQVFEVAGIRNAVKQVHLDPSSDEARSAVEQAFEHADKYDCILLDTRSGSEEPGYSAADTKGREKEKEKKYSFRWTNFPAEPLREDDLVIFLNNITDLAFDFAKHKLSVANPELRHRFAAPRDKHHAVPLSYEPDEEDMRPDFLLLPIEAFSDDFKTVDPKYINFTASRLVGESKNKQLAAGLKQMLRYARGLKRAQPWVRFVLGMSMTRDKATFLREDSSGTEQLNVSLTEGRGCIKFIRILLGLALADQVDLGHGPCKIMTQQSNARPRSDRATHTPQETPSCSIKRSRSQTAGGDQDTPRKKRKIEAPAMETDEATAVREERFVFHPLFVHDYAYHGTLFTKSSIRGKGTTVFCTVDLKENKRLALKMVWQDLTQVETQDAVMQRLENKKHRHLIVPFKKFQVERNSKMDTTLGNIRGFVDSQIKKLGIENRVLTISLSDLKRQVKYFWGVHDFVQGLRGALLGHQYLTELGILHCDISETNIVLGLRPEHERGYLIDLDMAILQPAEESTQDGPPKPRVLFDPTQRSTQKASALPQSNSKNAKAPRSQPFPYMSYNVLRGGRHTQFDDVESFLYVLLLFFFSYAGPLPDSELRKADEEGFVQSVGSGRLSHMRNWPDEYADWADGKAQKIGSEKYSIISSEDGATILVESAEFVDCLRKNWPEELHVPIRELIENSIATFYNSTLRTASKRSRTEVSHTEFISTLDTWLGMYADLEDKFSNCPFKQEP